MNRSYESLVIKMENNILRIIEKLPLSNFEEMSKSHTTKYFTR